MWVGEKKQERVVCHCLVTSSQRFDRIQDKQCQNNETCVCGNCTSVCACVCACRYRRTNGGPSWLFPTSEHQVNTCSRYEAPGRQVMSLAVKIATSNPIALIYEACQYPDCNNALARRWLVVYQVDNKHSLAARLTLYLVPYTHHLSCKRTQLLMAKTQLFFFLLF